MNISKLNLILEEEGNLVLSAENDIGKIELYVYEGELYISTISNNKKEITKVTQDKDNSMGTIQHYLSREDVTNKDEIILFCIESLLEDNKPYVNNTKKGKKKGNKK